ncbi:MAG: acyl carrier protein [Oscillospiraceae bacterium]|nr:acyl carrier protein [Oscillospiraceae bacterium]
MEDQAMLEKIKELIVNYVDVNADDITEESRFVEDLGFNSYDFMSLLGELENEFDVTVDESDAIDIHTVGEAVKYLEELKK